MKLIHLGEQHSALSHLFRELRSVELQQDRRRFRENVAKVGTFMAYEISKSLPFRKETVTTPLGKAEVQVLEETPVLAPILRAGLALHQGFLEVYSEADHCFISAFRKEGGSPTDLEVEVGYLAGPSLEGRSLIMIDPMLATGTSILLALQAMERLGSPKELHIACLVASPEGVKALAEGINRSFTLWIAALDEGLDHRAYIVPGLGDAGDLSFGEKL